MRNSRFIHGLQKPTEPEPDYGRDVSTEGKSYSEDTESIGRSIGSPLFEIPQDL